MLVNPLLSMETPADPIGHTISLYIVEHLINSITLTVLSFYFENKYLNIQQINSKAYLWAYVYCLKKYYTLNCFILETNHTASVPNFGNISSSGNCSSLQCLHQLKKTLISNYHRKSINTLYVWYLKTSSQDHKTNIFNRVRHQNSDVRFVNGMRNKGCQSKRFVIGQVLHLSIGFSETVHWICFWN